MSGEKEAERPPCSMCGKPSDKACRKDRREFCSKGCRDVWTEQAYFRGESSDDRDQAAQGYKRVAPYDHDAVADAVNARLGMEWAEEELMGDGE